MIVTFTVAAVIGTRVGLHMLSRIDTGFFFTLMKTALWIAGLRVSYQLYQQLTTAL